jgi:hypothetical protein
LLVDALRVIGKICVFGAVEKAHHFRADKSLRVSVDLIFPEVVE